MEKDTNSNISIITNNNKITGLVQPMSKNQLKKMKRKEEWDKKKKKLKKQKKERIKEKKNKFKEENPEEYLKQQEQKKAKTHYHYPFSYNSLTNTHLTRKEREEQYEKRVKEGIKIIIDCDFEGLMNEKSIYSMSRQISDCYCINRRSMIPLNLILYNVDTVLYDQLHRNNCEKWIGITIHRKGEFESFEAFAKSEEIFPKESGIDYKSNAVYLTADSQNEINALDHQCAYIIGGIVDRNRYKMLSFNKAIELDINHGRLPIGEYLKLNSSKVLTTNHVFAIISHFNDNKDWKEAFINIIPKRKIENNDKENEEDKEEIGEVEGEEKDKDDNKLKDQEI